MVVLVVVHFLMSRFVEMETSEFPTLMPNWVLNAFDLNAFLKFLSSFLENILDKHFITNLENTYCSLKS